ncbi:DAK2 domain-containing protein, partial [Streptomyces shenzhenensis]
GDHGRGMARGTAAAHEAARAAGADGAGAGTTLERAGQAWSDQAGGTSGALWAACLTAAGRSIGDGATALESASVAAAVRAGVDALSRVGGASVGDKTMLDSAVAFAEALEAHLRADRPLGSAWTQAAAQAMTAADATARLIPRAGRARTHGTRGVGSPDAGAVSLALVVGAVAAAAPVKEA